MGGGPLSPAFRPLTIGIMALVSCVAFEAMAVATAMPLVAADLDGESAYGLAFTGHGLDPAVTGLALTGGALGWSAGSFAQGRVKIERHRILVWGTLAGGLSLAALALLSTPGTPLWLIMLPWTVTGFAMGAAFSTTSVLMLNLSTADERGRNSASLQLADQLGAVIGTAGAGAAYAALRDPAHPEQIGVFVVIWVSLATAALLGIAAAARSGTVPAVGGGHPVTAPGMTGTA